MTGGPVVVIGGGHAGLCVVSALRRRDVESIVIDHASRLGDVWRNRYDGLHLNTERDASTIPGTTLPSGVGSWPTAQEWGDHVESAAAQLDVDRRVERVERVRSGDSCRWAVETDQHVHEADVVVVATGRNRVETIPDWPGLDDADIEVVHAGVYRNPDAFAGRRVLVVGAGNSGTEIAHLLCAAGVDVRLSMRTRPVWARRELFGSNLTTFARLGRHAHPRLIDASGRLMQPLLFGRLKRYGLGPPQRRLSNVAEASGATLDSGFIADVKAGRISLVAPVEGFRDGSVVLTDGSTVSVDVVIAATGSSPALEEFLPSDVVVNRWPRVTESPFQQAPGMFTAGLNPARLTAFHPDFITEAEAIADAVVMSIV